MHPDDPSVTRYNLLVAVGLTPQVITETVYSLARQAPPWLPARVDVLTSSEGAKFIDARLRGKPGLYDGSGRAIEHVALRWARFCQEILGGAKVALKTHIPQREGEIDIDDIRTEDDDQRFANRCYRLVDERTQPGKPPLVGSIAGGRKTMSAHLMTAFSVFGRAEDRLVHVLVPEQAERDRDFFYTTPEKPHRIARVDIPFPKFNVLLEQDLLAALPHEERDLRAILDALAPYQATEQRPAELVIHLGGPRAARLLFYDGDGNLIDDQCTLPAVPLTALLVFLEHTRGGREDVDRAHLMGDGVHAQRVYLARHFGPGAGSSTGDIAGWTDNGKVSDAVSTLNRAFRRIPYTEKHLALLGSSGTRTRGAEEVLTQTYYWRRPLPPIRLIMYVRLAGRWPFTFLPEPVHLDDL